MQGAVDAIQTLANSQVKSVAICLLNSFANSMHEEELAKLVQSLAPNIAVSLSSKVLPEIGEFERTSTTVINAYLLPVLGSYLDSLLRRLRHENYTGPLFMLQSGGGMIGIKAAQEQPVRLVESGPAAGVIAHLLADSRNGTEQRDSFRHGWNHCQSIVYPRWRSLTLSRT